jgi:hypothetical protein
MTLHIHTKQQPCSFSFSSIEKASDKNNDPLLARFFSYAAPTDFLRTIRCVSKRWNAISKEPKSVKLQLRHCIALTKPHLCKAFLSLWLSKPQCHKLPLLLSCYFFFPEYAQCERRFRFHLGQEWHSLYAHAGIALGTLSDKEHEKYGKAMVGMLIEASEKNAELRHWDIDPQKIELFMLLTVRAAESYRDELNDQSIDFLTIAKMRKILLNNLLLPHNSEEFALPFFTPGAFKFLLSFMKSVQLNPGKVE